MRPRSLVVAAMLGSLLGCADASADDPEQVHADWCERAEAVLEFGEEMFGAEGQPAERDVERFEELSSDLYDDPLPSEIEDHGQLMRGDVELPNGDPENPTRVSESAREVGTYMEQECDLPTPEADWQIVAR